MSRNKYLLAASLGFAIGYVVKGQIRQQYKKISPEKALHYIKETFQKHGPINGTWIYMKSERIKKNGLIYRVYRGGFSRNIDGNEHQFQYYADINTATIIHVEELTV